MSPIRGHAFCSFLALVLQTELIDLCRSPEVTVEWDNLIRDLFCGDALHSSIPEMRGFCSRAVNSSGTE